MTINEIQHRNSLVRAEISRISELLKADIKEVIALHDGDPVECPVVSKSVMAVYRRYEPVLMHLVGRLLPLK